MRSLLFRPLFTPLDMLTSTTAGALMLSGHWLAAVPVFVASGVVWVYGRKQHPRPRAPGEFRCIHCGHSKCRPHVFTGLMKGVPMVDCAACGIMHAPPRMQVVG